MYHYVKSLRPWDRAIHNPRDFISTNLNLLAPRMLPAKYSMHSSQWFMRSRFLKVFAIYLYINMSPSGVAICDPRDLFEQT